MFSLRRKKDEEDGKEEENEKPTKKRERKKKKEPPKPWGRGERILVFGVLLATVVVSLALALYARSWKLPGMPRLSLPEDAFEETFVLEGKPAPLEVSEVAIKRFNEATRDVSGVYGLYVIDLIKNTSFGISEDEPFQAASLIKLPVMAYLFEETEKDNLDLEDTHILTEADKVGGSGSLYYKPSGTIVTFREMIELMAKQSDNTAFNIVKGYLGEENIEEYVKEIGMRETSLETNMTTPRDIGLFFKKLWENRLINQEHKEEMLSYLIDTSYEDWIVKGLPDDIEISHKYGRELHVVNDAGIVKSKHPYVLVLMSKGVVEAEADLLIPELARLVHDTLLEF